MPVFKYDQISQSLFCNNYYSTSVQQMSKCNLCVRLPGRWIQEVFLGTGSTEGQLSICRLNKCNTYKLLLMTLNLYYKMLKCAEAVIIA